MPTIQATCKRQVYLAPTCLPAMPNAFRLPNRMRVGKRSLRRSGSDYLVALSSSKSVHARIQYVRISGRGGAGACSHQETQSSHEGNTLMGGQSSSTTTQQSQTAPWEAAQPMLQSILGQIGTGLNNTGLTAAETGALNTLQSNASQGNPYAGQIGGYAQPLLNGCRANAA